MTSTACANNAPIETWQTCAAGSNCITLANIQNATPVDPDMFNWTFAISGTNQLGTDVILKKSPVWIPMADRKSSDPFGTNMDDNWSWVSVPTVTGLGSSVGWFQLKYTNPITKQVSAVGTLIKPNSLTPPTLSTSPAAFTTYFNYTPAIAATSTPGYIKVIMYADAFSMFSPSMDGAGRQFPTFVGFSQGTTATVYQLGDVKSAVGPIADGSLIGLFVEPPSPPATRYFYNRLVTPTTPATGGTKDKANDDPQDLPLGDQKPNCKKTQPDPNTNMFPPSAAATADAKNQRTTNIVLILIIVALVIIVIIIGVIFFINISNGRKRTAALQKRVDDARKTVNMNISSNNPGVKSVV